MFIPTALTLAIADAKILIWELNQSYDELLEIWKEQNFSSNLTLNASTEKRKCELLSVRLALSALLGKEIAIEYNDEGKPFLINHSHNISISHSKNLIAVMTHPTCNVGIDIEINSSKTQKVYKRFLSQKEQTELSNGQNLRQLQIAWSAKEALYKIIGKEAVDFANSLYIFPFEPQKEGTLQAEHIPSFKTYTLNYLQTSAYTLLYCIDRI